VAVVKVWWWDPFGVAVFAFSGHPAAGFDQGVVGSAGQGQRVDIGAMRSRPFLDMVDFTPIAGHVTTRSGAAAVLGVQHNSLPRRCQPFRVIQRQSLALVEDSQIVMCVAGHADHVAHRQQASPARESFTGRGFEVF